MPCSCGPSIPKGTRHVVARSPDAPQSEVQRTKKKRPQDVDKSLGFTRTFMQKKFGGIR